MPKPGLTKAKWATEDAIAFGIGARESLKQIRFLAADMHQRGYISDAELRNYEDDWERIRRFVIDQLDKERAARGELG